MRKEKHDLRHRCFSGYRKHMKARKPLQGPLHSQKRSKTDSTSWLILTPIDLNLKKIIFISALMALKPIPLASEDPKMSV